MSKLTYQQKTLRDPLVPLIRRLHFYIGLFIGPFIFIAALTGTLYAITPQLENALYSSALTIKATGQAAPLGAQVDAARRYAGDTLRIYAVRPAPGVNDTTRVQFADPRLGPSESRSVFIDPYTLNVVGDYTVYGTSGVLPLRRWLDQLHQGLLLGDPGRLYSELAASWLWVEAVGGVIIWRSSRPKRQRQKARGAQSNARRWHSALGFVLLLGLLFFSATGLTWSQWAGANIEKLRAAFHWQTPQVVTALGSPHVAPVYDPHAGHHGVMANTAVPKSDGALWQHVLAAARQAGISASRVEIRPARAANNAWTVSEVDRSWPTQVDAVSVDPRDGHIVDHIYFDQFPPLAKLTRWGVDFHMGILFGLTNQLILTAFGAGLCVMIVLGYRLWWLRRPAKPAQNAAETLFGAWLKLSYSWRTLSLLMATTLGYCLPVMGGSLLMMLMLDILRWRRHIAMSSRFA